VDFILFFVLDSCSTYEDIKHLSICLYNLPWFLNESNMNNFVKKIEDTLLNKSQTDEKIKCTVKVLRLFNNPYWTIQNIDLTRSLLNSLQGITKNIALYDLIQLQMV